MEALSRAKGAKDTCNALIFLSSNPRRMDSPRKSNNLLVVDGTAKSLEDHHLLFSATPFGIG